MAGHRGRQRTFQRQDVFHGRGVAARLDDQLVALADLAGLDTAHVAAEIVRFVAIVTCHQLHREAKRLGMRFVIHRQRFQQLDQGRALVPGQIVAQRDHVVAGQCRQRNRPNVLQAKLLRELTVGAHDAVIDALIVIDQVHLVDGDDHMLDLQQMGDGRVALGLGQQLDAAVIAELDLGDVDQDDHRVCSRGASHHIAGVLFVAGGVGDDEFALRRREIAIRHVDRDALFAFGFQPVGQQRKVDGVADRALVLGARYGFQLVGEDALAVEQQTPDQRALAIVDRTGGDEAQQAALLFRSLQNLL